MSDNNNAVAERPAANEIAAAIETVLVRGDLAALTPEQRLHYYRAVCESVGLNPLTQPFQYITLSQKLVLYARKDATDQLRKIHGVSITRLEREIIDGVCVVTASASMPDGRQDQSCGAVSVKGLAGEALANALMKSETKGKRRVTLSICGLGMLDETEIDAVPEAPKKSKPKRDYPADGAELERWIEVKAANLSRDGYPVAHAELLAHVRQAVKGVNASWAESAVAGWGPDAIRAGTDALKARCAAIVAAGKTPAPAAPPAPAAAPAPVQPAADPSEVIGPEDLAALNAELIRTDRSWREIREAVGLPKGLATKDLSRGQYDAVMTRLSKTASV